MLLFQPLLWEEWDSNDCLFPFRLSRLALGRKIAAYSGGSNLERNCCKIWKIYSSNRSKMAFTTKSGHDSQGNEKIYFLAFFVTLFFIECHRTRIIGQFESLRIWIDRGWNAKDFRIEQKSEENCSSQQIEGWIRCFARWKKSSFSISLRRKNVNKNWNSDSLFSKGKNAWNIHKFMGHKRESQSWRKKWIKSFLKRKIQFPTFISRLAEKVFLFVSTIITLLWHHLTLHTKVGWKYVLQFLMYWHYSTYIKHRKNDFHCYGRTKNDHINF